MKKIIAAALIGLAFNTVQAQEMSVGQMVGEGVFLTSLALNRGQMAQMRTEPTTVCESMGGDTSGYYVTTCQVNQGQKKYTAAELNKRFLGVALTHVVITALLPEKYRTAWIGGSIAVEAVVIGRNKRLGLNVKF